MSEELAALLSNRTSLEFKPLFDLLYVKLRARNAASGGEEMLRLRAYEKLQFMVQQGIVTKTEKKYRGVAAGLAKYLAAAAELKAKMALGLPNRPPIVSNARSSEASTTTAKGSKVAKAQLPVRKAQKGYGKEVQEGGKAAA